MTRKLPEPIVRMLPHYDQSGLQSIPCAVIQFQQAAEKPIPLPVELDEWDVRDDYRLAHRMLKKAVFFVRRS